MLLILQDIPETPEDKAVKQIKNLATGIYQSILKSMIAGQKIVWDNQYGVTPQHIFDTLGTDGPVLLAIMSKLVELISIASGEQMQNPIPEGYTIGIGQDGRVIVTKV
jgi:hypothetical protein